MPYHLLISNGPANDDILLDRLLGSATVVDFYWQSIGRELKLQLISSIMERADSEEGFILTNGELSAFLEELGALEAHWKRGVPRKGLPEGFFEALDEIREAVKHAFKHGHMLFIC